MSARVRQVRHVRRARLARGMRGMTLIEIMVAIGVFALMGSIIYGVFSGLSSAKRSVAAVDERHSQGRTALARISRELQAAFISAHVPYSAQLAVRQTGFIGVSSSPTDRLDFTSFSHRRLGRDSNESDQNELGYFGSVDPQDRTKLDLVRREAKTIDLEPTRGGIVQVVAENIEAFELAYFDPVTQEWSETWDSTQAAAQLGRLPSQVHVRLTLKRENGAPLLFQTKVPIAMQAPLSFAVPR